MSWYQGNNLSRNVSKTKELVIDFMKHGGVYVPISIKGAEVEIVECFKFLGVNITNDLSGTNHIDMKAEMAHQHLYFLMRLRKFGTSPVTYKLLQMYIESILLSCITA